MQVNATTCLQLTTTVNTIWMLEQPRLSQLTSGNYGDSEDERRSHISTCSRPTQAPQPSSPSRSPPIVARVRFSIAVLSNTHLSLTSQQRLHHRSHSLVCIHRDAPLGGCSLHWNHLLQNERHTCTYRGYQGRSFTL